MNDMTIDAEDFSPKYAGLIRALRDAALLGLDIPKPVAPPRERKMTVDLPVHDMRIGMTYLDGRRKGVVTEVIPLGRRDRTHVEVLVKFQDKSVKHYRHEMIGTFETEV